MKPTDVLIQEHAAILLLLNILEAVSTRLQNNEPVDPEDLPRIVEFIRVFADKCHHGKEENLLFKSLAKAGMPVEGGPIAVMLAEHDQGRAFVAQMDKAATAFVGGDKSAADMFTRSAHGYTHLLAGHIQKENNVLFPMADRMIPPDEQSRLLDGFDKVEAEVVGHGVHERFHELLDRLKAAYLE